ncbi:leukocyte cell-derived chemotaxin 1-like [Poeciliopsis prolifica]|uniref:leukocyte cell-derived chemotaxin 1-like n=1 Tax=Poeciliopsis prolifica TaxID=188132 RepID=UPI002413769B|nr:leukocyte cell-derived chemotaxin 1-like [Poeciliopsis prolifica]
MDGSSEKTPIATVEPEDQHQFMPPAYSAVAVKPASAGRLLKAGIAVLVAGAVLLLLGAAGAFYFWNNNENHVYNVHYTMSINGKVEKGSMQIDSANNMETFSTGSGADEALEVHDFEIGITGIRFSGGDKCFIKTQIKAQLPDVEPLNKGPTTFDLGDEVMAARFEDDLVLVASGPPLSDPSFLSGRIMELCGDLPIFWLRPTHSPGGQRKSGAVARERRQAAAAAAEEREDEDGPPPSNPDNPYQRGLEGEQGAADTHTMLDHQGVCCSECRRGYTHCQRICEPLGHQSWPYHFRGCRVACRVIMPCKWWEARIMGLV